MKYYLVGIKGTGMASLACFLKDLGYSVVGSDSEDFYFTEEIIKKKKIETFLFNKDNITTEYIYIISNAYDDSNEEVAKIILNDFEYYYYDNFIGTVLEKRIIAISGTHGKTTTSSFLSQMFNKEASYIIGDGVGYGTNESDYLVLEACEYKDHFLSYCPYLALVTNIDYDHPDYFKSLEMTVQSFQKFISKAKIVILNKDDANSNLLTHDNIVTFGFDEKSDYVINIVEETKEGYLIKVNELKYNVNYKGYHYIYDFVGALVCMDILNKTPKATNLKLPLRRMTEYKKGEVIIIDDYAHHPKEIKCLYESIKSKYKGYKYNVIFQPHTYTRTIKLINEFISSLNLFDNVYIEKVFTSKREKLDPKNEEYINDKFSSFFKFDPSILKKIDFLKKEVWIFLGAGVVNKYILTILNEKEV